MKTSGLPRTVAAHERSFPHAPRVAPGDTVRNVRDDPKNPGWFHGVAPDGTEGYFPSAWFRREDGAATATAMRDYDAAELTVEAGVPVTVLAVESTWTLVRTLGGRRGWIPTPCVSAGSPRAVFLPRGEGRTYSMGRIRAVFKADGAETRERYSVSEWWLEPRTQGPGLHSHEEDDLFYVMEGTMSVLVGEDWIDAPAGSFLLIPGGTPHDFENRGSVRSGVLSFSVPGPFEPEMPGIVDWFLRNPPKDTGS